MPFFCQPCVLGVRPSQRGGPQLPKQACLALSPIKAEGANAEWRSACASGRLRHIPCLLDAGEPGDASVASPVGAKGLVLRQIAAAWFA
eukprot:4837958-Amphidinium_carterae.1